MAAEPDPADLLVQAQVCPVIKGAYAADDPEVVKRIEAMHPPSKCEYVKQAADEKRMFEKERGK